MSSDFQTKIVRNAQGLVGLTSTNRSSLISDMEKLIQKVIHCMLTKTGDDVYYPDYGCIFLEIVKRPVLKDAEDQFRTSCAEAIAKVKNDIISLQDERRQVEADNDESLLLDLQLVSVKANTVSNSWEINMRVTNRTGQSQTVNLPF